MLVFYVHFFACVKKRTSREAAKKSHSLVRLWWIPCAAHKERAFRKVRHRAVKPHCYAQPNRYSSLYSAARRREMAFLKKHFLHQAKQKTLSGISYNLSSQGLL